MDQVCMFKKLVELLAVGRVNDDEMEEYFENFEFCHDLLTNVENTCL